MEDILTRIRNHYHLSEEEHRELTRPSSILDIPFIDEDPIVRKAIERLSYHKAKGNKVIIYGDYDTDGVSSASILLNSFRRFGLQAEAFLPSRYLDGYGLNVNNVEKIAKAGYSLIFTTDNGVTAHEALRKAQELGVEVIILDHHDFDGLEIESDIVIHPDTVYYGDVPISAGYLAFLFSKALLGEVDEYLLSLGAISTLSDAMPLKGYNRHLVRLFLDIANKRQFPVFVALTNRRFLEESVFQMEIIPKINSVGRYKKDSSINRLLKYFVSPEIDGKEAIANWINETNIERKAVTKDASESLSFDKEAPSVVAISTLPEGLNGLLASRLLNEHRKPIAIFAKKEGQKDMLVGSLRSDEGFDLREFLSSSKVPFLAKGGHPFAAGCSIKESDYPLFKKEFDFFALKNSIGKKRSDPIEIKLNECNWSTYKMIRDLAPYGQGFEPPTFILKGMDPLTFTYIKDGKYLSLKIKEDVRIFSFELGESSFEANKKAEMLLSFSLNEWRGKKKLDIIAKRP